MHNLVETRHHPMLGDEALRRIDGARDPSEALELRDIREEFPFLESALGKEAVTLFDLTDNEAGSFKWRGALNAIQNRIEHGATRLVVASAGNHARGAIVAARAYDIPTTIVVPTSAPPKKRQGLKELWDSSHLTVISDGDTFDESLARARSEPGVLIHPYDDPDVIAGQGTVVDDFLRLDPEIEQVIVPVGGGGLLAGVVQRLDELGHPADVYAVQAEGSDSLANSLAAGRVVEASNPNKRFGGSCVRKIGHGALDRCLKNQRLHVKTVSTREVEAFIADYAQSMRDRLLSHQPFEPTTLVACAAIERICSLRDKKTVVLGTGANEQLYTQPPARFRSVIF